MHLLRNCSPRLTPIHTRSWESICKTNSFWHVSLKLQLALLYSSICQQLSAIWHLENVKALLPLALSMLILLIGTLPLSSCPMSRGKLSWMRFCLSLFLAIRKGTFCTCLPWLHVVVGRGHSSEQEMELQRRNLPFGCHLLNCSCLETSPTPILSLQ